MATVKITNSIRYHVRERIYQMFKKREEDKNLELHSLHVGEEAVAAWFSAEEQRLAVELNNHRQWTGKIISVLLKVKFAVDGGGSPRVMTWRQELRNHIAWPASMSSSQEFMIDENHSQYAAVAKIAAEMHYIHADRDNLQSAVHKILTDCGTLRQVLEVWPGAMDFMPESAKNLHAQKVEKAEKKVISEVDATTQVLLAKSRLLAK